MDGKSLLSSGWPVPLVLTLSSLPPSVLKGSGGLLILGVCCINMYLVVLYVSALNSVWLYVVASFLSIVYLAFVGYLVSMNLFRNPRSLGVE